MYLSERVIPEDHNNFEIRCKFRCYCQTWLNYTKIFCTKHLLLRLTKLWLRSAIGLCILPSSTVYSVCEYVTVHFSNFLTVKQMFFVSVVFLEISMSVWVTFLIIPWLTHFFHYSKHPYEWLVHKALFLPCIPEGDFGTPWWFSG